MKKILFLASLTAVVSSCIHSETNAIPESREIAIEAVVNHSNWEIRTPKISSAPQLPGPGIFGVVPGKPFMHDIANPNTAELRIQRLPDGVKFKTLPASTLLSGIIAKPGIYNLIVTAESKGGTTQKDLMIVVRDGMKIPSEMTWQSAKTAVTAPTANEQYSQVSLWTLTREPISILPITTKTDAFTHGLLANDEVLDVWRDPSGVTAKEIYNDDGVRVYVKPMADGSFTVGVFNLKNETRSIIVDKEKTGFDNLSYQIRDLWRQKDIPQSPDNPTLAPEFGPHDCVLYRYTPRQ